MQDGLALKKGFVLCFLSPKIHEREIKTLGEKIAAVSENGRATEERLNALIHVVERQISEGRNGKP